MDIKKTFEMWNKSFEQKRKYAQAFDDMMKVRNNPIQDFIDNKISFKELKKGLK